MSHSAKGTAGDRDRGQAQLCWVQISQNQATPAVLLVAADLPSVCVLLALTCEQWSFPELSLPKPGLCDSTGDTQDTQQPQPAPPDGCCHCRMGLSPAHLLLAQICVSGSQTDALTENPLHAELQFRLIKTRAASLPADGVLVAGTASSPPSADSSGDRSSRSGWQPEAGQLGLQQLCSSLRAQQICF